MPIRVLVADDEEFERRAVARLLSRSGLEGIAVIEAANGREAVERARAAEAEGGLAVAFLDIRMPGLDGIEAARRIRERDPALPIVFLTAHDRFEYARSALRLRIDDFLLKPASAEEILAALTRALAARAEAEGKAGGAVPGPEDGSRLAGAASWLADALRAELAEGRVREEGLGRWRAVSALQGDVVAAVALRIDGAQGLLARRPEDGRGKTPGGGAGHPAVSALERGLGRGRMASIAGAAGERALCLVLGDPPAGEGDSGRLRDFVEEATAAVIESLRSSSGLVAHAGCAYRAGGEIVAATALARAAACAAALAVQGRPVVSVPVAATPGPACREPAEGAQDQCSHAAARALAIMEDRLAEDLSLDSVAEEVGVSPSHLSRLLARQAGMGFSDCLAAIRVERARSHLAGGASSVKEVAGIVGFHDPAYFARVFRRFTGLSPVEYRDRGGSRGVDR